MSPSTMPALKDSNWTLIGGDVFEGIQIDGVHDRWQRPGRIRSAAR